MAAGISAANLDLVNNPGFILALESIGGVAKLGRAPVSALTSGLVVSATTGPTTTNKAQLDALLNYPENTGGQVVNDTNAANNGIYRKVGASGTGSWTRIADLYAAEAAARLLIARDLGVIPLTSVAQPGLNTITASMLVNAGTTGITPTSANAKWKFTPVAGNTGACTLQIDSGPVSPLVRGDGTPLRRGDIRNGESVLVERRADGSYRIVNLTLRPRPFEGGLKATAAAVVQSITAPPSWDTGRPPFNVIGAGWYTAQSVAGRDSILRTNITNGGTTIDLTNMVAGTSVEIYAVTQTNVFAGDNPNSNTSGASFVGQASSINYGSLAANSSATFKCVFPGRIKVESVAGSFTYASTRFLRPPMDVSVLFAGQSHMVIGSTCGGIGGFAREMMSNEMGNTIQEANKPAPDRRNFYFINGATSGTTATYSSGNTEKTNVWWNETSNNGGPGPGPVLTNCLNKILEARALGQPWPTVMFWGQGDGDGLRMQQGTTLPLVFKANTFAIWNYLRNYESSPGVKPMANMKVIVFPPGSIDSYFTTTAMTAIRTAFLELITDNAWAYYGGEMYDLPRSDGQEHLSDDGCYAFGQRWALAFQAAVNGKTIDPGPVLESAIYYMKRGVLEVKVKGYGLDGKSIWPIPYPGPTDDDRNPFGFQFITGAAAAPGVPAGSITSSDPISTYPPINVLDARCTDASNSDKRRLTFEFLLDAVPTTNTFCYSSADWSQHVWRRSYPMSLVQHGGVVSVPIPFQRAAIQFVDA